VYGEGRRGVEEKITIIEHIDKEEVMHSANDSSA